MGKVENHPRPRPYPFALINIDFLAEVFMAYDPDIHHRRSIRLKGYDYSSDGAYFVTICVNKRKCLLGTVTNNKMELNLAGEIAKKWWLELQCKFNGTKIGEYIIMPNHIHGIIIKNEIHVRADLCVCPNSQKHNDSNQHINGGGEHTGRGEHSGSPLHEMVQWFKTMTTNEYMRRIKNNEMQRFDRNFWQRNYYERIIRDDMEWYYTEEYIIPKIGMTTGKIWMAGNNHSYSLQYDFKVIQSIVPWKSALFLIYRSMS